MVPNLSHQIAVHEGCDLVKMFLSSKSQRRFWGSQPDIALHVSKGQSRIHEVRSSSVPNVSRFLQGLIRLGPNLRVSHARVCATLHRLTQQAGGYADMERHVPELHNWVKNNNDAAPVMRCAILEVVSWFPGVLQQLWIDVSVRRPPAERHSESAPKPGFAAIAGGAEKTQRYGTAVLSWVFETYGRLGVEGTKLRPDLVPTSAANGQCSPHAVGRWRTQLDRVLLSAQADTYLRAPASRVAERPAAEPPLLLAEWSVHSSVSRCVHRDPHV